MMRALSFRAERSGDEESLPAIPDRLPNVIPDQLPNVIPDQLPNVIPDLIGDLKQI